MSKADSLVVQYIYLAVGCGVVGVALTYALVFACQYFGISLIDNLWLAAIPVVLTVLLNVSVLELYRKHRKDR